MAVTSVEIKNEAINRIKTLIEKCNLNPKVLKYFKEGKVYYSYLTAGGFLGSIDTISYDKAYEQAAKKFEMEHPESLVYHVIETITLSGKFLSLLYVSNEKEDWESERLQSDNAIMVYVLNLDNPELSEFGYITVEGFGESGALVRTDII